METVQPPPSFSSEHPRPTILLLGGFGYGNVGDEAQLSGCIDAWRRLMPAAKLIVFSPNPSQTASLHGVTSILAPRQAWFKSETKGYYFRQSTRFFLGYALAVVRLASTSWFYRRNMHVRLCTNTEFAPIKAIASAHLLHLTGGGYLTGATRSRLWESCLTLHISHLLGTPSMATGQTIGLFSKFLDRKIAAVGLAKVRTLAVRDHGPSINAINRLSIHPPNVIPSCDDATFSTKSTDRETADFAAKCGIMLDRDFVAVNFHHWGHPTPLKPLIAKAFASLCDKICRDYNMQIACVPMAPSDINDLAELASAMRYPPTLMEYTVDHRLVRGIISKAQIVLSFKHHPLIFAQGECVPSVAVATTPYYLHKNRGALANTGHQRFVIDDAAIFKTDAAFLIIKEAFDSLGAIRAELEAWRAKSKAKYETIFLQAIQSVSTGNRQ